MRTGIIYLWFLALNLHWVLPLRLFEIFVEQNSRAQINEQGYRVYHLKFALRCASDHRHIFRQIPDHPQRLFWLHQMLHEIIA